MGLQVCAGAQMQCSFGTSPATLSVLPANKVNATASAANINDYIPFVNVPTFGSCSSSSNPVVAAATAAAAGALTPMPCVPCTASPWAPGSTKATIGSMPALEQNSILNCMWGGVIQILNPGQTKVNDA